MTMGTMTMHGVTFARLSVTSNAMDVVGHGFTNDPACAGTA